MSAKVTVIQSAIDHTSPAIRTVRKRRNVGQNMEYAVLKKSQNEKKILPKGGQDALSFDSSQLVS